MRPNLKRTVRRSRPLSLGARYNLFQMLAGHLFGATHAVVAAQCTCADQSLHETVSATGLMRNTVDIILHDFRRAGLGRYSGRIFRPCVDAFLEDSVNRVARTDAAGVGKAAVKNRAPVLA